MMRRLALALIVALLAGSAGAQPYPTKPVRLVLGFAPGGVADIVARLVAPKLGEALGQQVIVDNRQSAGGIIAAETVAKAEPDGHTLLLVSGGNAVSASLYKSLNHDPVRDFAMVSTIGFFDLVVLVNPKVPVGSLRELIDLARARPGAISIGTVAIGSTQNLGAELLRASAGVDMVVVPYRATPAMVSALVGGEIDAAVEILAPVGGHIDAGSVRALAITSAKRSAVRPDIPSAAEGGLPGYEVASWNGIAAPARTSPAIVERLNRELVRILGDADMKKRMLELGVEARSSTPEWLRDFFVAEADKWATVIAKANIPKQ
jgi:tripartite-type tricarboxylate transporter receptor subunit TctC